MKYVILLTSCFDCIRCLALVGVAFPQEKYRMRKDSRFFRHRLEAK